jgi:nitroreductase
MDNKFLDAMNFRFATKEFDSTKKISDDDFNAILEYARLSPSSFGFEPWKFVIVQSSELREKLQSFCWGAQGTLPTASHYVMILARKRKGMEYNSPYIKHMMQDVKKLPEDTMKIYSSFYEKFQKEDFKLLESDRSIYDWSCKQTYIALANMMSGGAYMGIDSCAIEGFDIDKSEEFLQNDLQIDTEEFGVSVMVAFGYRKDEPKRGKVRQDIESITQWV